MPMSTGSEGVICEGEGGSSIRMTDPQRKQKLICNCHEETSLQDVVFAVFTHQAVLVVSLGEKFMGLLTELISLEGEGDSRT